MARQQVLFTHEKGEVLLEKIDGGNNPADGLTKAHGRTNLKTAYWYAKFATIEGQTIMYLECFILAEGELDRIREFECVHSLC